MGAVVGRSWDSDAADSGTGPWPWLWLWLQVRRDIALAGGKLVILEVVVGVSISMTMRGAGDIILHILVTIAVKIMFIITTAITCSILPQPSSLRPPPPRWTETLTTLTLDADRTAADFVFAFD